MVATSPPTEPSSHRSIGNVRPAARASGEGPIDRLSRLHASLQARNRGYALLTEMALAIKEHQPSLLARQAAYSLLYAVPSMLIMLISLAAIVDKNTGSGVSEPLRRFIAQQAPEDVRPLLESLVQYALVETSANTAIVAVIVSLAIAIWGAAGGVGSLTYAINEVYEVRDTRSFIKGAAINIGVTLLGGVLVVAAFVLLAFGRLLLGWLPALAAEGGVLAGILASGPLLALVLFFCSLLLLYWFALDAPKSLRWLLPGAVVATVAMGLLFALIDLILSYSNPGAAYGVAGSVLILLWTLFVLSVFVIAGAIINAVLGKRFDRTLKTALRSQPFETVDGKRIAVSVYR
jgi:membrane protein